MFAYCGNNPVIFADQNGVYRIVIIGDDSSTWHNCYGLDWAGCCAHYIDLYSASEVTAVTFTSADTFIEAWNSLDDEYDMMIIYAHGSPWRPTIWCQETDERVGIGEGVSRSFSELKPIKVNHSVKLNICYAAREFEQGGIAKEIANLTQCQVTASNGSVHAWIIWGISYAKWCVVQPDSRTSRECFGSSLPWREETR